MNSPRRATGFSLIELMIAITLGLLAIAAVGSVFIYGSRNYKQDDKISRMQDELRFAMAQLTQDLEMAGFFAQIRDPSGSIDVDATATVTTDCGPTPGGGTATATNNWVYYERRAGIATLGNATASDAAATFPCIESAEFVAGTDILGIKRLGEQVTSVTDQDDGRVFLRTNGVQSLIYRQTNGPTTAVHPGTLAPLPTGTNVTVYEYRPAVWYIRDRATDEQSPRVPSLCRETLEKFGTTPRMEVACVAQGIVDMQLEFGLDSAASPDGIADSFVEIGVVPGATPRARAEYLARVVAVRVHLLARSSEADVGYKNEKTYVLAGNTIAAANDGYYRKVLSSIVLLRNPANRLNPFALPSG